MKKILFLSIIMLLIAYGSSMADWQDDNVTVGNDNVTLSNNVRGDYITPSDNTTYSAATYNKLGTYVYGAASDMSNIKYEDCTNTPCGGSQTDPLSNGNKNDFSGNDWKDVGE